jgi:hypothetical protein
MINSAYCAGFALAADYASPIHPTGYLLSLLFGTRIAVDSVWPNSHWACMHLLLNISLLESPSNLTMFKLAPFVRFSEPLPVVFGVNFRTLATEHFHIVAA